MSNFFNQFPLVDYAFGDEFNNKGGAELTLELFQDLSAYVELIDELKDIAPYYKKYYVLENDRPDQVSNEIYGTPNYHWTFFLMNDNIRRSGWPLSMQQLDEKVKRDFPHKFVRSRADLTGIMIPGQRAFASNSAAGGTILRRNLDLGEIIIQSERDFTPPEQLTNTAYSGVTSSVTVFGTGDEYNATHHYENGDGERVDIDPRQDEGALVTRVTNYDYYVRQNDKLKEIRVIRPDAIQSIVGNYFEGLKS